MDIHRLGLHCVWPDHLEKGKGGGKMKVVCAWCKKVIHDDPGSDEISHGICDECYAGQKKELDHIREITRKEYPGTWTKDN